MALTIKRVGRLTTKGKYADGGGLYLQVHSATNRSWLFRYQLDGQRREMGLGSLKDLTLDQAREAARAARLQKRDGLCPMAERHKLVHANTLTRARDKTFQEVADAYFDFHKDKWQAKWQKDFARHMRDHMLPTLGAIPVSQMTPAWCCKWWSQSGKLRQQPLTKSAAASRTFWTMPRRAVSAPATTRRAGTIT